ncbi:MULTISPECIES: HAD hydrolase-like protein [Rhodomicrobium]|uniref:HAD hydrolase-like protein n=1 Tax=Rhodomicrobium TaxID=1068 RepID=UPI000B4A77D4|nr:MULTISPECIES: HAD hydrolase-like protein [Rhodomicrobium]
MAQPAPKPPLTVVFDLDGTLAHTSPDIAAALNATLDDLGRHVGLAETERMVGGGLDALLRKALLATGLELDEAETEAAFARLMAHYRAAPAPRTVLHNWVAETMIGLHGEGARIAVCSNKAEDLVLQILDALDVARWMHAVVGHVPGRGIKPDAEPLLLAIRDAGGEVSRAVLVGDSGADVGSARAAGIPVILVPHGYGSRDIRTLGADRIVTNAAELRAAIAELTG